MTAGGAEVVRGVESLGGGVAGRGEDGRGEVEGAVATIGGVVVMMGEEAVLVRSSEAGSETGGGDGAIGVSGCAPSAPTARWSPTFREVSEAVVEAVVFWAVVMRAFLTARSAVLESRFPVGGRLRVPASEARGAVAAPVLTGMSTLMSSKSIGRLTAERRRKIN